MPPCKGPTAKTREIRCWDLATGALVDTALEGDPDFFGEYFIAVSGLSSHREAER